MLPIIEEILSRVEALKREVEKPANVVDPAPKATKDGSPELDQYVEELWLDSQKYARTYYEETKHLRRMKPDEKGAGSGFDREAWDKAAEALAYGENWEYVWGHRPEDWMKERVDGEIPRKMTVRKDTVTAKYHEFTIAPNIEHITSIYDQERERMGAQDWIEEYTQMALTYGQAVNEITLDFNLHPDGQVKNVARRSVGRTPGAKSFQVSDGCDYVIFSDVVTARQIETDFPKVDVSTLSPLGQEVKSSTKGELARAQEYMHTKFFRKFRVYMDDPTLEKIPFTKEEESELIDEQQALMEGQKVDARQEQNHMMHINQKVDALLRFLTVPAGAPENMAEQLLMDKTVEAYILNLEGHLSFVNKNKIETLGLRQKYPHGRYICWIGGRVLIDTPNPMRVPWRKLVREIKNRTIQGRSDGAGDPEAMYREAFQLDMQLSRIEELTLKGVPKVYRHISDKENKQVEVVNDNDPLKTSYYNQTPPVIVQSHPPTGLVELYKIAKGNIERDTNVNSVARGDEQPSGTPASLVAMIQRQNRIVVAGELDRNLRAALKDIIEGNLAVMREMYTEPRQYVINGQIEDIVVADRLKFVEVAKGGRREKVEVPMFEVTIKAGSNLPDQWETKLALLLDLRGRIADPAKGAVLDMAIMDHLAQEYPEFGENGKYRVIEEATQIGLKVLEARERLTAEAQADQDRTEKVFQGVQAKAERQMIEERMGAGGKNGAGKAVAA